MIYEGSPDVFTALREKIVARRTGQSHEHIRPLLVIGSGVMRGIYGGAIVTALTSAGYNEAFTHVVGVSTGSPTAAYFLAGDLRIGTSIYCEECTTREFISTKRIFSDSVVDIDYLMGVFGGSTGKALNTKKVLGHPSQLWVQLTDFVTGGLVLFRPDSSDVLIEAIKASITMPGVYKGASYVRGGRYVDGCYHGLVVKQYLKTLTPTPTHVLVVANRHPEAKGRATSLEWLLQSTLWRNHTTKLLRRVVASSAHKKKEAYTWMRTQNEIPLGIIWTDRSVRTFERNRKVLNNVSYSTEQWMMEQLGRLA